MVLILRGAIVNRTYDTHKNLYIYLFLLTILVLFNVAPRNSVKINRMNSWYSARKATGLRNKPFQRLEKKTARYVL